jgi:hypothetical protein
MSTTGPKAKAGISELVAQAWDGVEARVPESEVRAGQGGAGVDDIALEPAPVSVPVMKSRPIVDPKQDYFVTADNIISATVKNNQGKYVDFNFKFRLQPEEIPDYKKGDPDADIQTHYFSLERSEINFLLDPKREFNPWFDQGLRAIRFEQDRVLNIPTYCALDSEVKRFQLRIRMKELAPILQSVMDLPEGNTIDFTKQVRLSAEMSKPKVEEDWSDGAYKIFHDPLNRENGIEKEIETIRLIARNSSAQDCPALIKYFPDSDRSLLAVLSEKDSGNIFMTAGIIWHGERDGSSGIYSIHT